MSITFRLILSRQDNRRAEDIVEFDFIKSFSAEPERLSEWVDAKGTMRLGNVPAVIPASIWRTTRAGRFFAGTTIGTNPRIDFEFDENYSLRRHKILKVRVLDRQRDQRVFRVKYYGPSPE
ncbi:hypothetical protein [Stenotrophomonas maltophilia]|uniref:hypothetical protein n=1 Tax=Stenotrophomonas maltophilia TaxID=40324 RepID=UPI0013D8EBFF|nr:hypothetical protein [Stenotrophomonas maltophilia]